MHSTHCFANGQDSEELRFGPHRINILGRMSSRLEQVVDMPRRRNRGVHLTERLS